MSGSVRTETADVTKGWRGVSLSNRGLDGKRDMQLNVRIRKGLWLSPQGVGKGNIERNWKSMRAREI